MSKQFQNLIILSLISIPSLIKSMEEQPNTFEGQNTQQLHHSEMKARYDREVQILLNMYELVTLDPEILNKSLIEVATTYTHDVVKKYLACNIAANLNQQDDQGRTSLFIATDNNNKPTVKLLAEQGADINIADGNKLTPLHVAIKKSYISIAKYLIAKQALVNKQTTEGETALHFAIKNMDLDAVKIILASDDVNLHLLDQNSHSPLSLVIATMNSDLIKLFGPKLKRN